MTTKWEFLDHPGPPVVEAPYLYDDQNPPSYVEKTSAGVWSLVKTGALENREDQLAGNNWDYISDDGTTVSFYFKSWDAGGYWSGPYLRATWPSNSSGDTITVTNINNGDFYLKQPASSGSNPLNNTPAIFLSGSWSKIADGSLAYTIAGSSPTSSTANGLYDIRFTLLDGTTGRMFQPNTINHTNGTTDTIGYLSASTLHGVYELIHIDSSLNNFAITVLATYNHGIRKKVFCNFW